MCVKLNSLFEHRNNSLLCYTSVTARY